MFIVLVDYMCKRVYLRSVLSKRHGMTTVGNVHNYVHLILALCTFLLMFDGMYNLVKHQKNVLSVIHAPTDKKN